MKKYYWIAVVVCVMCVFMFDASSDIGLLAFLGAVVLILFPILKRSRKKSKREAEAWFRQRQKEIHADQLDYQSNMNIYHNMMNQVNELRRREAAAWGFEKKQLQDEADRLEFEAKKYYRTLF